MDWKKYPNFTKEEFNCTHTGKNEMQENFMDKLQELRGLYGKPMVVTSGFRDITHPLEAKKLYGGMHTKGMACDIGCGSIQAYQIVKLAIQVGFTGIGINQKGEKRFIHLDLREQPLIYSY